MSNRVAGDAETANGVAKFLVHVINDDIADTTELTQSEQELWENMHYITEPIVNNFVLVFPNKSYIVSVKPVSK
jgi:hypothetical protein